MPKGYPKKGMQWNKVEFSKEEIDKIINLYKDGKSLTFISKQIGYHSQVVKRILKEGNIKLRTEQEQKLKSYGINHDLLDKKIISMYINEVKSTFDIAKDLNMNSATVYAVLKRHKINMRDREEEAVKKRKLFLTNRRESELIKSQNKIIIEEYKRGTFIKDIAKKIGLKEKAIQERIKSQGVELNRIKHWEPRVKINCACGCGQELWHYDSQRRYRNYIYNHHTMMKKRELRERLFKYQEEMINLYKKGYNTNQLGKIYKTSANVINPLLKSWGVELSNDGSFGKRCKGEDGHILKSGMEKQVCDFLHNHGIVHSYEKQVGETRFLCDFFIQNINTYIEIFGRTDEEYKERMLRKLKVYQDLGLNLLQIFPQDNIQDRLKVLLQYSKTQKQIGDFNE